MKSSRRAGDSARPASIRWVTPASPSADDWYPAAAGRSAGPRGLSDSATSVVSASLNPSLQGRRSCLRCSCHRDSTWCEAAAPCRRHRAIATTGRCRLPARPRQSAEPQMQVAMRADVHAAVAHVAQLIGGRVQLVGKGSLVGGDIAAEQLIDSAPAIPAEAHAEASA